VVVWRWP